MTAGAIVSAARSRALGVADPPGHARMPAALTALDRLLAPLGEGRDAVVPVRPSRVLARSVVHCAGDSTEPGRCRWVVKQ